MFTVYKPASRPLQIAEDLKVFRREKRVCICVHPGGYFLCVAAWWAAARMWVCWRTGEIAKLVDLRDPRSRLYN